MLYSWIWKSLSGRNPKRKHKCATKLRAGIGETQTTDRQKPASPDLAFKRPETNVSTWEEARIESATNWKPEDTERLAEGGEIEDGWGESADERRIGRGDKGETRALASAQHVHEQGPNWEPASHVGAWKEKKVGEQSGVKTKRSPTLTFFFVNTERGFGGK